jgi:aminopeptidase
MADPRVQKLAQTIVDYSASVKSGDTVYLTGEVEGLPLVREVYKACIHRGAFVVAQITDETLANYLLRNGNDEQIAFVSPNERWRSEDSDVSIFVRATSNTRAGTSIDPKKESTYSVSRQDLAKRRSQRTAEGKHRWTLTQFPTEAYAQEASMTLEEFEDFVYSACFADQPDPIQCWHDLRDGQQKYVDWLKGRKEVVVRGPNIDMKLRIDDRTFINSEGTRNMPSGEIFTGPVEESVNGWVRFTYPGMRSGRVVEGVELKFENGKVVNAKASKNEEYLLAQLDTDAGARYLGEWAIGTNYGINRFTGNILFDEKIGGTIHMALGNSYPETGGKNKSAIHWDLICDMRDNSEITVDGDLLYKNGKFVI